MELLEIIKQTIFLLILFGFGIFSLSYSISKIRTRSKIEPVLKPIPVVKKVVSNLTETPKSVVPVNNNQIVRKTSERFIVLNDLSLKDSRKSQSPKKGAGFYQLQSIRNTGMYTLTFE